MPLYDEASHVPSKVSSGVVVRLPAHSKSDPDLFRTRAHEQMTGHHRRSDPASPEIADDHEFVGGTHTSHEREPFTIARPGLGHYSIFFEIS